MFTLRNLIAVIASVAVIGIAVNVFAHGMGWGDGWSPHHGNMPYSSGYGNDSQLSADDYKKMEQSREAFFKDTEDIRAQLFEKERDLQNELAKSEPDAAKASKLQKEVSDLQSQFDQKRIDHMVEIRKVNPGMGRGGYMYGGSMMGYGPYSGGGCR